MSGVELTLRHHFEGTLDASPILPERLLTLNQADIERTPLEVGGRNLVIGDLFSIAVLQSTTLVIQGPVMNSYRWGREMSRGHLVVECDVGDEAGLTMRGGMLELRGSVGDRLGCGMQAGRIQVIGNAGNFVGCPEMGKRRGMRGGLIAIDGNAGDRLGDCMRRGTILVHGNVGDYAAARMIAGTIAICGNLGKQAGVMMRRGTVWAPRLETANLSGIFSAAQRVQLPHLTLWYRWLVTIDSRLSEWRTHENDAQRWLGDLSVQGLGEFISPAPR